MFRCCSQSLIAGFWEEGEERLKLKKDTANPTELTRLSCRSKRADPVILQRPKLQSSNFYHAPLRCVDSDVVVLGAGQENVNRSMIGVSEMPSAVCMWSVKFQATTPVNPMFSAWLNLVHSLKQCPYCIQQVVCRALLGLQNITNTFPYSMFVDLVQSIPIS